MKPTICLIILVHCDCFRRLSGLGVFLSKLLPSNEVSWDMKWRPAAEADLYVLAGQNIYRKTYRNIRVIFWSLTKVRNMQKLRSVHFAILQSWRYFGGSIHDVHFCLYKEFPFVHACPEILHSELCAWNIAGVSVQKQESLVLVFITSGRLILVVNQ